MSAGASRPAFAAAAGLLLAAVLLAYLPALSAGFVWDDDAYVTQNRLLDSPGGLARIWLEPKASPQYYPVTFTSFWIERRLLGDGAAGFHLVNVLLHGVSAILLYRLLLLLGLPGALLGAALFALHPIQVESVAWITERKNVLSGVWFLLAALAYCRFAGIGGDLPAGARRTRYAAALACFLLALGSKSVAATLPALLLLLLVVGLAKPVRTVLPPLVPFIAAGAACGALTAWLERIHVGAAGAAWDQTLPERILIAGRALWFYLGTLLWPTGLTFIYPRWRIDASSPAQWLAPLAFAALAAALWASRRRVGPVPATALLCYAAALAPALGFVSVYPMLFSFVADHFAYLATIPALAAIAAGLAVAGRSLPGPWLRFAAAGLLLLALGGATWRQTGSYRDLETLWRSTLDRNPDAWIAHNNLGVEALRRGETDAAELHFLETLAIVPDNPFALMNLGDVALQRGDREAALARYRGALRADPGAVDARCRLGEVLSELGRDAEAAAEFRAALAADPRRADAHVGLAVVLFRAGDVRAAAEHYRAALDLDPGDLRALNNLAAIEADRGSLGEAESLLRTALRLRPGDPTVEANLREVMARARPAGPGVGR